MKYYVVLIVTYNDGSADKLGVYSYNTEDEAIKNFFKYMSQFVDVDNVSTVTVEAKDNFGLSYKADTWARKETATSEE